MAGNNDFSYPRLKDMVALGVPAGLVYRDSKCPDSHSLYVVANHNIKTGSLHFVDLRFDNGEERYTVSGDISSVFGHEGREHYQMEDLVWVQDRDLPEQVRELVVNLRERLKGVDFSTLNPHLAKIRTGEPNPAQCLHEMIVLLGDVKKR